MRVTTMTHQHVKACPLDPCSVDLSPSRLASILPVPREVSQSKEAWSNRRFEQVAMPRQRESVGCEKLRTEHARRALPAQTAMDTI